MMFFLARSALCIGLVAAAAGGVGRVAGTVDRGTRQAIEGAGRACLASAACLTAGVAALSAGGAPGTVAPGSHPRAAAARRPEARPDGKAGPAGG